jgi:hypothetical protein
MSEVLLGKGDEQLFLQGRYGNRHGLVAGATGTGKSVTLLVMAEGFSRLGVPVVIADAKGDIAEAHLLFNDCPPALRQRVEQVVRLIRSKGVGVYFCSQNPDDIPNEIPRPARQPRTARAARVHAARPEGCTHGGGDVRAESGRRCRARDNHAWHRRGARFAAWRARRAAAGAAGADLPAALPHGRHHAGRACDDPCAQPGRSAL